MNERKRRKIKLVLEGINAVLAVLAFLTLLCGGEKVRIGRKDKM